MNTNSNRTDPASEPLVNSQLVYAHSIAALITLLISITFGIIVSLQFFLPDLMGNWLPLGWGRLRYAHTQGIMLGWLGNAFIAFLYHAVPVLTGQKVTSPLLGRWLFGIWNFVVMVPGWILVLAGISQPIEWAEFPLVIDAFVIVGFILLAVQFLPAFFRRGLEDLYVSSWYIIGGLVFTLLAYPMGNIVPELVPGAASAAFGGLWIHDAVGLFVTPLALAIIYFVIPAVTGRPIYSHFLSMLGFWGLFFLYPLNGTHHYVFSVIPMAAQMGAIVASALLGVIVVIVVSNLLLSLRGAGYLPKDVGLRFVVLAIIFYLIVSVQGALQAQMSLNQAVHFTDWVIGHSHLAMLGFATFAGIGGIIHAWQRIAWVHYNAKALNWSFTLLSVGISIMVIDLTIAGVIETKLWQSGAPWLESIQAAKPYWFIRTLSAIPISAGFIALFLGLCTGPRGTGALAPGKMTDQSSSEVSPQLAKVINPTSSLPPSSAPNVAERSLRMSYLVATIAGLAFFAGSVTLLGIWPERILNAQIVAMSPPQSMLPTPAELRGRAIYAREGCAYCHTQQIRYVEADIARFGAPTLAWETQYDFPHMWGTRRIGPDLSRAGATRSLDWQYAHLFSPRSIVPLSIMPNYAAFFDGSPTRPKQEARDLVAYIESLGRARELAWPEGDIVAKEAVPNDIWAQMSFNAPVLNAHAARTQPRGNFPDLGLPASSEKALQLWLDNCATCHGVSGGGDGPAAKWLSPAPSNLAEHQYSSRRISDVLWNGVKGSAMPAWRDQPYENLSALVVLVQSFSTSLSNTEPPFENLDLGQQIYNDNCTQCHGKNGNGAGFAANELPIAPTNFRQQSPSLAESLKVLSTGIEGSSMAPWTDRLNQTERLAVVQYLRHFFDDAQAELELELTIESTP